MAWDLLVRVAFMAGLLLALLPAGAVAGIPPSPFNPYGVVVIPTVPNASESFVVRWDAGLCRHSVGDLLDVSRTGNQIHITIEYDALFSGPPGCTGFQRQEWRVGPYPRGVYEIVVAGTSPTTGDNDIVAVLPLTIVPGPPSLIPVNSPLALATLFLLTGLLAAVALSQSPQR